MTSKATRRLSYGFFSSRRRHTRYWRDWSSDVCSSDLRVQKLNRVFDGDDVVLLLLVDEVDDGGERRGLARARRARDEHDAVAQLADVGQLLRQTQRLDGRDLRRDDAHHDGVGAALLEDVDAEARARRQRVAEVGRAGVREALRRV